MGLWVFGSVERQTGKFLVLVTYRTADTLMAVIDAWIKPGTTIINDCWATTGISTCKVICTAPAITASALLIGVQALIPTPSSLRGACKDIPQPL